MGAGRLKNAPLKAPKNTKVTSSPYQKKKTAIIPPENTGKHLPWKIRIECMDSWLSSFRTSDAFWALSYCPIPNKAYEMKASIRIFCWGTVMLILAFEVNSTAVLNCTISWILARCGTYITFITMVFEVPIGLNTYFQKPIPDVLLIMK